MAETSQNQAQVSQTLANFLATQDLPQAYLFLGSSKNESDALKVAQQFAAQLNSQAVDSLMFDAASGLGVEGVRQVLQLAALKPVAGKYKIVTLLNMQQASTQMLNALLKTLEEPPQHAVFLLISTTPLLATVMSRCQVFNLRGDAETELSDDLAKALKLLQDNKNSGQAEKMVLVNSLADLEDDLLPELLELWLNHQVAELKTAPQKFTAVRATADALLSLRGNFNKKMVLQQFVTNGLA